MRYIVLALILAGSGVESFSAPRSRALRLTPDRLNAVLEKEGTKTSTDMDFSPGSWSKVDKGYSSSAAMTVVDTLLVPPEDQPGFAAVPSVVAVAEAVAVKPEAPPQENIEDATVEAVSALAEIAVPAAESAAAPSTAVPAASVASVAGRARKRDKVAAFLKKVPDTWCPQRRNYRPRGLCMCAYVCVCVGGRGGGLVACVWLFVTWPPHLFFTCGRRRPRWEGAAGRRQRPARRWASSSRRAGHGEARARRCAATSRSGASASAAPSRYVGHKVRWTQAPLAQWKQWRRRRRMVVGGVAGGRE